MERRSAKDRCHTSGAARERSNVVVVDFANCPRRDLRDMDNVHRNVATGRLADAFIQLASIGHDLDH